MPEEVVTEPRQKVLKGKELDRVLNDAKKRSPLDPKTVDDLLQIDTERLGLSKADKWVPGALMAAHIATLAAVNFFGGDVPPIANMPEALHEVLQAIHNLSVNSAETPALRDHIPYLLLEGAGIWGAAKTLPSFLNIRTKRTKIKEAQASVRERIDQGEQAFKMKEGHTAAFVGSGDRTGELLSAEKPEDEVILYASAKLDSRVWERISSEGLQSELFNSLDRGDFEKAGEVVLFPIKDEDMFLPDNEGHDMTIDEMRALIRMVDDYCEARGIEKKRVIIVGRRTMSETYTDRTQAGIISEREETLQDLVESISESRQAETEIFDPTEVIVQDIITRAQGRQIQYSATSKGDERYGERLIELFKSLGYEPTKSETLRVLYDITDTPTEERVDTEDLAVVLDTARKHSLINRGMSPENIIVVPELILENLSREVNKS
ncbi:MAG: hypothetical protein AABX29_03605 [Nanoarchaeota archaeon]